ncbi:MAG: hypothetical protein V1721_03390 [Pseudomonadota bacterium]
MKKYLTFAFLLGAIAFTSISYLAQAQVQKDDVAVSPAAEEMVVAPAVSFDEAYTRDSAECHVLASASTTEGAAPSDEVKEAAFRKCMTDKKYSEEDIAKEEAMDKEVMPPVAPEIPVAPESPAKE